MSTAMITRSFSNVSCVITLRTNVFRWPQKPVYIRPYYYSYYCNLNLTKLELFSLLIPKPSRHSIRNVRGSSCKSNGTSSFGMTRLLSLASISESISCCHNFLFGHVTRLQEDVPAHKALNCHVDLLLRRPPSSQQNCHPGHPHNGWVDQIWRDNNLLPANL